MSTANILPASRDANSYVIFPVPAHKSKISKFCKENVFSRMLNNPSFAKSVVGLDGKFFGMLNLLDFKIPLIIRKLIVVLGVSKE